MDHGRDPRSATQHRNGPGLAVTGAAGRHGSTLALDSEAFQRLFGLAQDLFAIVDLEGTVRYANGAWARVLGYAPEEVVGRPLSDFLHPTDVARTRTASRQAIASGRLDAFENRFQRKDGRTRWLQWDIQVDRDLGVAYGTGRDTSARHAAETARAVSEATYQALFDTSIDGVVILDPEGTVLAANAALRAMLGYGIDDVGPVRRGDLFDESDPAFTAALETRQAKGRFFGELRLRHTDGAFIPAEVSAASFVDDVGRERTSLVVRDISERRRLVRAAEESDRRRAVADTAMNAAANAIVITDAEGTIEWVNRAFTELTGYGLDEAVGKKPSLLKSGEHPPAFYRRLWSTVLEGEVWRGELLNRRKDGSVYPEAQTITPVLDEGGRIAHFIAIKQDVSERRRSEQALRASEASFRQLFRDNPLPMYVFDRASLAFLAVNEAMVRYYGYTEEELLGMTLRDIRPAEDVPILERRLAGPMDPLAQEGVWRHPTRDGRLLEVDITTHAFEFQGHDARLTVAQDVTERLHAERELQASEERYRMLAENAVDVVFRLRVRPAYRFEYVSPSVAALIGYTAEDHYADPSILTRVMHPDDLVRVEEAAKRGEPFLSTIRWIHRDGHVVHSEQHSRPIRGSDGGVDVVEGIVRDVSSRVLAEQRVSALNERLERNLERFKAIHRVDTAILVDGPLRPVLAMTLDEITRQLRVDAAAVFRMEPGQRHLRRLADRGMPPGGTTVPIDQGLAGEVVRTRLPVRVHDARASTGYDVRWLEKMGFRGCFALPLVSMGRLEGVLELYSSGSLDLDDDAQVFTEALAQQVALAIQRDALVIDLQTANRELQDAYDDTIEGWARALDLKDEETAGHSQRVTRLTLDLAERLGVPRDELEHVRRGALLHDIGKMGIPDSILLKPGRLTEEEFDVIRRHPVYAADMLKDIAFLQPAVAIPRWHHERWDGTGYPDGLAGEAIPLAARIFAVVDVYDALTSDRPYRQAWTREAALEHIRERRGSHFDPQVVDAFLAMSED